MFHILITNNINRGRRYASVAANKIDDDNEDDDDDDDDDK